MESIRTVSNVRRAALPRVTSRAQMAESTSVIANKRQQVSIFLIWKLTALQGPEKIGVRSLLKVSLANCSAQNMCLYVNKDT